MTMQNLVGIHFLRVMSGQSLCYVAEVLISLAVGSE